jgi:hypothetical protein
MGRPIQWVGEIIYAAGQAGVKIWNRMKGLGDRFPQDFKNQIPYIFSVLVKKFPSELCAKI